MCLCSSKAKSYDESLKHLEALQELNKEDPKDPKIAMNKAVVEFYKSDQTTVGTLKQTLMAVKNQVIDKIWIVSFLCFYLMLDLFSVNNLGEHRTFVFSQRLGLCVNLSNGVILYLHILVSLCK